MELDESSPMANSQFPLKPHQRTILYRCMQLESGRLQISKDMELETQVGVIADKAGSGKSHVILSIISMSKVRDTCVKYNSFSIDSAVSIITTTQNFHNNVSVIFTHHSLVLQWTDYARLHPNIRFYVFDSARSVYDIPSVWDNYDLVICSAQYHNQFVQYTDNHDVRFARAFYDDADNLHIKSCYKVNASFYWFVTSSIDNLRYPHGHREYREKISRYVTLCEGIRSSGYIRNFFNQVMWPSRAFQNIIVKNKDEFVEESLGIDGTITNIVLCKEPLSHMVTQANIFRHLKKNDVRAAMDLLQQLPETNIVDMCINKFNIDIQILQKQIDEVDQDPRYQTDERRMQIKEGLEVQKREVENKVNLIKDRLQTTSCPICFETMENKTIMKCCSNAFCVKCIGIWVSEHNLCPICKSNTNLTNLLIVNNETQEKVPEEALNDKIMNVMNIIREDRIKKILLFSEYDYVFNDIIQYIDLATTTFYFLKGNTTQTQAVLKKYKDPNITTILFLNPYYHGCGLNLENTTDVIFLQKFDNAIEKQIIGRAQRIGRKSQLRVWHFLYNNEIDHANHS